MGELTPDKTYMDAFAMLERMEVCRRNGCRNHVETERIGGQVSHKIIRTHRGQCPLKEDSDG